MESPTASSPSNRTATDSLVSVPLSDSARFSIANHQTPGEAVHDENQDEDEEVGSDIRRDDVSVD